MKRIYAGAAVAIFLLSCSESTPGLPGPPGERGPQGELGPQGPVAPQASASSSTPSIDAAVPPRSLVAVWRDSTGVAIPVVNVKHSSGALSQDIIELWTVGPGGVIWSLGVEGTSAVVNKIEVVYKSADCTGDAYTVALPALMTFRDDSQPQVTLKYFPTTATSENFLSGSRRLADGTCSLSMRYAADRIKLGAAITVTSPSFAFKAPYRVSME